MDVMLQCHVCEWSFDSVALFVQNSQYNHSANKLGRNVTQHLDCTYPHNSSALLHSAPQRSHTPLSLFT